MVNDALFSSDKNFWETPQKLFDELDAEFHFTLDVAASDENHKCARYFTQSDDGLRQNGWTDMTVLWQWRLLRLLPPPMLHRWCMDGGLKMGV